MLLCEVFFFLSFRMQTYLIFGKHIFNKIITESAVSKSSVSISGTPFSSIHRQELSNFLVFILKYVSVFSLYIVTHSLYFVYCIGNLWWSFLKIQHTFECYKKSQLTNCCF